ncbi:ABC transporter substrate-binding protein [Brevundimonas sp. S30B]|uniref:ABC transporter substrate-binding protein n=1 Tax=unclassified Brevundimonas TaxID=2622653 RepID=UPI0010719E46|nr:MULTISPECIES: ABC transporter substrate-binding protein [unclassified Brevundimonas]QBX38382.1 ABC transporter substrate-binding protein [Brevundimonas sp. MF30-B]TFW02090.1 ABC transporter substrate-binding protein [Brevundimonas sp. S30B]
MLRRSFLLAAGASALSACSDVRDEPKATGSSSGTPIPLRHARYLKLERHGGYAVARLRAPVADQSGGQAQEQEAVLVLAPREGAEPTLPSGLRDATVIRTPVMRIAANASSDEAFLGQLGVKDRLVAVGGRVSYDDDVRRGVIEGRIGQIGYNWHAPPNLDVLLAARPDVFLMRLSDLSHTPVLDRARRLGLTVAPTFAEDEPSYLGRAEWIRLHGLLTGREAEAERLFDEIETRVEALKAAAAARPAVPALWAYPAGGDRWVATVRGAEQAYLADAGGRNLLLRPEDPRKWSSETLATEQILPMADQAEVWIVGDLHAAPPRSTVVEGVSPAFRAGRLFANTGRSNLSANAYDWYQTAFVRPDWVLADFVKALHPELVTESFRFLKPVARGVYR